MTAPNSRQNPRIASGLSLRSLPIASSVFLIAKLRIDLTCRSCWRISRDTFSERSSQSMTPFRKRSHSGSSAFQSSMMWTRFT